MPVTQGKQRKTISHKPAVNAPVRIKKSRWQPSKRRRHLLRIESGCAVVGFGAAHHEPPPHELLIMKFIHGTFSLLDGVHRDETETLGLFSVLVSDDLDAPNSSNSVEEFRKVVLTGIKGQVAHIEFGGGDLNSFWLPRRPRSLGRPLGGGRSGLTRLTGAVCARAPFIGGVCLFLGPESEETEDPLKESGFGFGRAGARLVLGLAWRLVRGRLPFFVLMTATTRAATAA